MKFRYKGCTYNTDFMNEADKALFKEIIEAKEKAVKEQHIILKAEKQELESKPVERLNKLPYDKKKRDEEGV